MNTESPSHLSDYFTSRAIILYVILLFACFVLFPKYNLPLLWIGFGLLEVVFFFHFSNKLSLQWAGLSDTVFKKQVFTSSLIIRVIYVVIIYYFYQNMTGQPFEFSAADSQGYHGEAVWMLDLLKNHRMEVYFNFYTAQISDRGFPLFLFGQYFIFGQILIIPRLINAVLGAWTVVLIYKIAKRNFGEAAARITAVLAMLLPNLIYYCGLHLKEILMVFLLVAFFERADYLFRFRKKYLINIIVMVVLGASLFLFRTVLAVSAWLAVCIMFAFSENRKAGWGNRILILASLVVALFLLFPDRIMNEVDFYVQERDTNQISQMRHFATRKGGNRFAVYGSKAIFLSVSLIAPFPTMVDTGQENVMMTNGAMYTRNVYVFFVIIALLLIIKRKLIRKYILFLSFIISHLYVLSSSGFALSERFHLPVLPFLLILSGYGITQINSKNRKYFFGYLVVMAFIILFWNWFKLAGRGLF